jgi:hypothetical protein
MAKQPAKDRRIRAILPCKVPLNRIMNRPFALKAFLQILLAVTTVLAPVHSFAKRPAVSWISEGVTGGATFLICGDGFQPNKTEVLGWVPEQPAAAQWDKEEIREASLERFLKVVAPKTPSKDAQPFTVIEQSSATLAARSRNNKINDSQVSVQTLWVRTPDGISDPVVVNKPIIWWSTPEFPAPGGLLRVFGRNMNCLYGAGRSAMLRDAEGRLTTVEWGTYYPNSPRLTPSYEFELKLASNLPAGRYELYLHNGSGGDLGWSEPHPIIVRSDLVQPNRIVKAADYGAIPDDDADDNEAIQRAMDELSKAGGGVVQLGPGTFLLKQTLRVPSGVILRGNGEESTRLTVPPETVFNTNLTSTLGKDHLASFEKSMAPLVSLANQCGLERLSIQGVQNTICALIGGEKGAKQISIRDAEFVNRESVWHPYGKYLFSGNCVVVAGPIDSLQIINSRFEGAEALFGLPGMIRRAVIAGNRFESYPPERSDVFTLRNPVECLVENNFFEEGKRGIVVQSQPPSGMAMHNVFSRNIVEHIRRGSNAGEMELWEVSGSKRFEVVKSAGPDSLTTEHTQWKTNEFTGKLCLIVDGRGLGQYRLISGNTADRLVVDHPWKVNPSGGARFIVTPAAVENLILNDTDRDGDAALQFWGTCIGNVVAGEIMSDTEGAILHGHDSKSTSSDQSETALCWFNDFWMLRFLQGAHLSLDSTSKPSNGYNDAPPLVFGNTVRQSTFSDGPRLPHENRWWPFWELPHTIKKIELFNKPGWEAAIAMSGSFGFDSDPDDPLWNTHKARTSFNLIERNFVEHWPVGIYEARSAADNIFATNQIMATKTNIAIVGKSER